MPYPVFSWNPERWMSKFVRQIPHEQVMAIPCTLIYSGILLGISVLRPFRTPWKNFHLHKWCSKKGPLTWKIYLKCNYNNQLKLTPADHWPPPSRICNASKACHSTPWPWMPPLILVMAAWVKTHHSSLTKTSKKCCHGELCTKRKIINQTKRRTNKPPVSTHQISLTGS